LLFVVLCSFCLACVRSCRSWCSSYFLFCRCVFPLFLCTSVPLDHAGTVIPEGTLRLTYHSRFAGPDFQSCQKVYAHCMGEQNNHEICALSNCKFLHGPVRFLFGPQTDVHIALFLFVLMSLCVLFFLVLLFPMVVHATHCEKNNQLCVTYQKRSY
jgi:hypothetical protein